YFDIDPERSEVSIETGLPVHNITGVRCLPGAAGTILNNLVVLGVGTIRCLGLRGDDGEGFELQRALAARRGVDLAGFVAVPGRHTFTYTKPLLHRPGRPPEELSRLDLKNVTTTPESAQAAVVAAMDRVADDPDGADAWMVMDQVDIAETGVVTVAVRERLGRLSAARPELPILADSRRSLEGWPAAHWKMNAAELARLAGRPLEDLASVVSAARSTALRLGRPVFVTMAEQGMIGASADGAVAHAPAHPVVGPIDIVGAGDSVSANLTAALAAGANLPEAMQLAMAAAHCVIHQLGTTGTASVADLRSRMFAG
ncbi:MAG: bifunctional heptose 7-phosphate kinase/heptose 1-phosphate adenyltransferase, partial [Verrucomicrobiota bacterium]